MLGARTLIDHVLKLRIRYLLLVTGLMMAIVVVNLNYIVSHIQVTRRVATERKTATMLADDTYSEDTEYSGDANYVQAVLEYKQGNFSRAIEELSEEIRKSPKHAQAYYLLGRIYEDIEFPEGKYYARMVDNYEKYLFVQPHGKRGDYVKLRLAQYYVRVGLTQRNVEMLDKAERYLKELGASDPAVRMALGAIYLNKSDYDKAIASFERSASLNENDIKIKYNSLGLAYLRKGQYAKAESVLEIAVEFDPNNKYAHNNLGYAYARQGKHHEAGIEFRKALAIDPNYRNAKVNLQGIESRLTPKRTRDR